MCARPGPHRTHGTPETTKSFRGAFFSPFARAYPPELGEHGISRDTFLRFCDELNEAFVASPAFRAVALVGMGMSFVPLLTVSATGAGIQTAAGVASAGVSYARTRAFIKATNEELFHPAGFHATVLSTKKMMTKVGMDGASLQLPPLPRTDATGPETLTTDAGEDLVTVANTETPQHDPRMRRIHAMADWVQPLEMHDTPGELPEGFFKRINAKNAQRLDRKQNEKLLKERRKAGEKKDEKLADARKEFSEAQDKIIKVENKMAKEQAKFLKEVEKAKNEHERAKVLRKQEKKMRELDEERAKECAEQDKKVQEKVREGEKETGKVDKKEHKIAQKIRWVVITAVEDNDPTSDDVESH